MITSDLKHTLTCERAGSGWSKLPEAVTDLKPEHHPHAIVCTVTSLFLGEYENEDDI